MSQPTQPLHAIDLHAPLWRKVFLLCCGMVLFVMCTKVAEAWPNVQVWSLADNDDAMRVLQVQDWLAGQAWFDVRQYRINPPMGADMHWSRYADLPLAATTLLAGLVLEPEAARKFGAFITPPLIGAAYLFAASKVAIRLGGQLATLPALALCATALGTAACFMPGRVDHHGLQLFLLAVALWGLTGASYLAGFMCGLCIALSICIGLEALPLQVILIAWVVFGWAMRGDAAQPLTLGFGLGFGLGLPILFALSVPVSAWTLPVNDAVGRGHVALGTMGGLLLAIAAGVVRARSFQVRSIVLVGIACAVLPIVFAFREVLTPPYANVDPLLKELWLNNVSEAKPVMRSKLSEILSFAAFPVVACLAALCGMMLAAGAESKKTWVLAFLVVLTSTGLMIFWQVRVSSVAGAMAGIVCAGFIGQVLATRGLGLGLLASVVLNPIVPSFAAQQIARTFEPKPSAFKTGGGAGCYTARAFSGLASQPKGLVAGPIDIGARLLLTTHHSALAAPYHRNNQGNLAAYQAFLLEPAKAQTHLKRLGVRYVAICTKSAENQNLATRAPMGLMANLQRNVVPAWLVALPKPKGSDIQAYVIKSE